MTTKNQPNNQTNQQTASGLRRLVSTRLLAIVAFSSLCACSQLAGLSTPENMQSQSLSHDGEDREYLVYVPASYDGSTALPLMLNFHGGSMAANSQIWLSDMRSLADSENFIVVYPQGTGLASGDAHWNTMMATEGNKSSTDDIGFIDALIDEMAVSYNVDTSRVYATGYSNGAGFAYALGCHLSDKIAAIAPVSGLMLGLQHGGCNPTHPTPVISFNGTDDGARPYGGIDGWMLSAEEANNYWSETNNISGQPTVNTITDGGTSIEHSVYSGGQNNTSIEHYKIIGGGHDWFDLNINGADTNRLIWDFVSRYDTDGLR